MFAGRRHEWLMAAVLTLPESYKTEELLLVDDHCFAGIVDPHVTNYGDTTTQRHDDFL